jgi:hypothetical protein
MDDVDVQTEIDDGGAAFVADGPHSSVGRAPALVPTFPAPRPPLELFAEYRHRAQRPMREWVTFAFTGMGAFLDEEAGALRVATTIAAAECGRALLVDILTARHLTAAAAREDWIRRDEWVAEHQIAEGVEP